VKIQWYGQSAFALSDGRTTVFVDPFDDLSGLEARGLEFNYPQ
jgi:L-ascorbate metabolism protein UlaG (beta-lactamase superfamily)